MPTSVLRVCSVMGWPRGFLAGPSMTFYLSFAPQARLGVFSGSVEMDDLIRAFH